MSGFLRTHRSWLEEGRAKQRPCGQRDRCEVKGGKEGRCARSVGGGCRLLEGEPKGVSRSHITRALTE